MELYSFDVFDTLITRRVASPQGIFALMQKELCGRQLYGGIRAYLRQNFFYFRIHAEEIARKTYQNQTVEDVTLGQIYEVIGTTGNLSVAEQEILMELECRLEAENAVAIEENIVRIKELHRQGKRVILISDMYLSGINIKKILARVEPLLAELPLYVSVDYGKGKWTGHLYEEIGKQEKADFAKWHHVGDNPHSDVTCAAALGIHAKQYHAAELLPAEKKRLAAHEADAIWQLSIGASRYTRIQDKLSGAAAIGSSIGGPILFPYVRWLLAESLKKGIKRLYFIARDGYILKQMADCLIRRYQYPMATFYLYGSRRAWRLPAVCGGGFSLWEVYRRSYDHHITMVAELADFLEISEEKLSLFLPGVSNYRNKKIPKTLLDQIIEILVATPEFIEYIQSEYRQKRERVIAYLKQELNVADHDFAFVDLGGSGFTQGCLTEMMGDFYQGSIRTFFYRLDRMHMVDNCENIVFFPNGIKFPVLLEMLCRAPHGQTVDYKKDGVGKYIPQFNDADTESIIAHGVPEFIRGTLAYVAEYDRFLSEWVGSVKEECNIFIKPAICCLEYLMEEPDATMMQFFGDMPDNLTGREQGPSVFAPALTGKDLRNIFLFRTNEPLVAYYRGTALEYSLKRCSEKERQKIAFYEKYRDKAYGKFRRSLHRLGRIISLKNDRYATLSDLLDKNLILYGAGKKGQYFYHELKQKRKHRIVLWVDRDYKKYQEQGLPVTSSEEIKQTEYDQILIAVADKSVMESIREYLRGMGVEPAKILWLRQGNILSQ